MVEAPKEFPNEDEQIVGSGNKVLFRLKMFCMACHNNSFSTIHFQLRVFIFIKGFMEWKGTKAITCPWIWLRIKNQTTPPRGQHVFRKETANNVMKILIKKIFYSFEIDEIILTELYSWKYLIL